MRIVFALLAVAALCAPLEAKSATTVSTPYFDRVELRGGGHVVLTYGTSQTVHILSGSTTFTRIRMGADEPHKLVIEACNAQCPDRYDLQIEIVTPQVAGLAVSGGGKIETRGNFPRQRSVAAAVHGGGVVDTRSIDAAKANVAVEGGGEIRVKVRDNLVAAINGGGKIRYWGNAGVTEAVNGGGSVEKGL